MTPQLANQFATLAVKLFVLVVLPFIVYLANSLVNKAIASLHDKQLQTAANQLVTTAEATLAADGPKKLASVLDSLKGRFPGTPVDTLIPVVETEVAKLHIDLGTFTPAKTPTAPAPAPIPVLDAAALTSALKTGLSGLVPAALTGQVADLINSAFSSAATTLDKAVSPVVEAPVAPVVAPDKAEAGAYAIVLPAGAVAPVTEPTPLT